MSEIKVSLFASSVRPKIWPHLFESLKNTSVSIQVVFAGNTKIHPAEFKITEEYGLDFREGGVPDKVFFSYIPTKNIKPAQCYEIARRSCRGEVVVWIADDCEFPNDVVGKAYQYWKSKENEKLILSLQTKESGYGLPQGQLFDMNLHRFYGGNRRTPLMAPLGMMRRKFLNDLGGLDRRYVCGQYENDIVMRATAKGGVVEVFGGPKCFVDIDHLGKSILLGESKTQEDFLKRPFATGYEKDRQVLEASWQQVGNPAVPFFVRADEFEPYEDKDLCEVSQSNKGKWE